MKMESAGRAAASAEQAPQRTATGNGNTGAGKGFMAGLMLKKPNSCIPLGIN